MRCDEMRRHATRSDEERRGAQVVCSDRWTAALLRLACEGKVGALRLLVQLNTLGYEELVLKETLPPKRQLKLYDFGFVERMGECQRLPPSPSESSALATVVYRWRLDAEPVGCCLSQASCSTHDHTAA